MSARSHRTQLERSCRRAARVRSSSRILSLSTSTDLLGLIAISVIVAQSRLSRLDVSYLPMYGSTRTRRCRALVSVRRRGRCSDAVQFLAVRPSRCTVKCRYALAFTSPSIYFTWTSVFPDLTSLPLILITSQCLHSPRIGFSREGASGSVITSVYSEPSVKGHDTSIGSSLTCVGVRWLPLLTITLFAYVTCC